MSAHSVLRVWGAIAVVAVMAGCAVKRDIALDDAAVGPGSRELTGLVEVGSQVRMVLYSGETVEGKVAWVTGTQIALLRVGEVASTEWVFETIDVKRVEVARATHSGVRVLGVVVGVAILFAIVQGFNGMSFLGN